MKPSQIDGSFDKIRELKARITELEKQAENKPEDCTVLKNRLSEAESDVSRCGILAGFFSCGAKSCGLIVSADDCAKIDELLMAPQISKEVAP